MQSGSLVQKVVASRSVSAAGRRKHKTADARRFRKFRQADRGAMVNIVGEFRIEITEGIVGEGAQVDNRIKPFEIGFREIAKILSQLSYIRIGIPEIATCEEVRVQSHHIVSRGLQNWACYGADVAFVTGQN
jgi:hypothetical protein